MAKMFLMVCVVWISGTREDGGLTNCLWHISEVKYTTTQQCESDIKNSKKLVIARLRKEFGDRPEEYTVQASCLKVA
tara:strand:+ start:1073 stop:1303 length:231 start_codon:yes stop_codon:yes gene_type:complete